MKTINIDGKEFSEETVKEALKKHCDFEKSNKEKQHIFKPGDVVVTIFDNPRLITNQSVVDLTDGGYYSNLNCQKAYEGNDYKYVGRITDFINKDTIERFLEDGEV